MRLSITLFFAFILVFFQYKYTRFARDLSSSVSVALILKPEIAPPYINARYSGCGCRGGTRLAVKPYRQMRWLEAL